MLVATGLVTAAVFVPPAQAQDRATTTQHHRAYRGIITFAKNYRRPDDSTLTWKLKRRTTRNGKEWWALVDEKSWRAGSGMGGKRGTNACIHNVGWLPNGVYHVRQYADYHGSLIQGRAFRVDDKRCSNGTLRVDLFIHTEQGLHDKQCPNRPGDQPCRWEYPEIDDYHSHGCIKLAPGDLASLVRNFREHFATGKRYPKSVVELRVIDGSTGSTARRAQRTAPPVRGRRPRSPAR